MRTIFAILYTLFFLMQNNYYQQDIKNRYIKTPTLDTLQSIDNLFQKEEVEIKSEEELYMMDIIDFHADTNREIFMIDRKTLYHFTPNGDFIKKYSRTGSGPGEFKNLNKILVDKEGNIFLEDLGNQKIIKMTKTFKYLTEFKKKDVSPIRDWKMFNEKYLVCFHLFTKPYSIFIYDAKTGKLIKKQGIANELFSKNNAYIIGGGMAINENNVFYIPSLDYQIYSTDIIKNTDRNILKKIPSHFQRIHDRINLAKLKDNNFSFIDDFFLINNNFYVISYSPPQNGKPNSPICDIISMNGNILKTKLPVKYLVGSKQYDEQKFLRVIDLRSYYMHKNIKESPIKIRFIKFKN